MSPGSKEPSRLRTQGSVLQEKQAGGLGQKMLCSNATWNYYGLQFGSEWSILVPGQNGEHEIKPGIK